MNRFLFWIGGAVCHQLPERSLSPGGVTLPLCARCSGIYLGIAIVALYLFFFRRRGSDSPQAAEQPRSFMQMYIIAALCTLPMQVDGVANVLGVWGSNGLIRMLTGMAFGFSLPVFFSLILFNRSFRNLNELIKVFGATLVFTLGVFYAAGWGQGIGFLLVAALITAFTAFVYLLLKKFLRKSGKIWVLIAFGLAWVYIGTANFIRQV